MGEVGEQVGARSGCQSCDRGCTLYRTRWVVVTAGLTGRGKVKRHWVAVSVRSKGCHVQELDKQWGKQRCPGSSSEILEG